MQRRMLGVILLMLFPLLLAACARPSGEQTPPEPPRVDVTGLDAFFDEAQRRHAIPGMAVVVVDRNGPLYVRGFGRDGEGNPITPRTPFRLASLSKSYTAFVVLQLVEQGRIDLDAPVQRYLPDFTTANPTTAAQITVRHLLNQTSGLSDARYPDPLATGDLAARVADLRRARPVAAPGTTYAYFNPNYEVLGRLVEVVGGEPFMEHLAAALLEPAGLWATGGERSARSVPRGHLMPFRVAIPRAEGLDAPEPSGGLVATADDLGRYLRLHLRGGEIDGMRLLGAESVALLHTPAQGATGYGMGWYVNEPGDGPRLIQHGGALQTYSAQMALLPDEGLGVALLYNENHALAALWLQPLLLDALARHLSGDALPEHPWPARWIGLGVGVVALLSVLGQVGAILRIGVWRRKAAIWARRRRLWARVSPLLSLLWLLILPLGISLLMGRRVTLAMLFSYTPELIGWLYVGIALNVLLALARGWPLRTT